MPKNEKILGKYSNQENRDKRIHVYKLADELNPEICFDLDISYTDDEYTEDQTSIHVLASTAAVDCIFTFGAIIDASSSKSSFIFGDTFGNEGRGTIDLSTYPLKLKLETADVWDDCTLLYYKEYELYRVKEIS